MKLDLMCQVTFVYNTLVLKHISALWQLHITQEALGFKKKSDFESLQDTNPYIASEKKAGFRFCTPVKDLWFVKAGSFGTALPPKTKTWFGKSK